ncbi:MAG: hypothetical protein JSW06_07385 [Thermoplasmatales archaeon]|nr:MAG: hypothetical protein JSW06_07385 [Thermoplasmatales archaeon]
MKTKINKDKAKKMVEKTASKTIKFTTTIVKLIFIIIVAYTIIVTIWVFLKTGAEDFLTNIATISVGGFWAFFLGYFGWRMGQTIEEYFIQIKKKK